MNGCMEQFGATNEDSGCEMDDDDCGTTLFTSAPRIKSKGPTFDQSTGSQFLDVKGKGREKEEVAAAISPGGHINKRRARRRPLSAELLESVGRSPSPSKVRPYIHDVESSF